MEFHLRLKRLLEICQKLVEQGHGEAIVYHSDGRSGIDEGAGAHETIETNVELADGQILEEGFPIYFW